MAYLKPPWFTAKVFNRIAMRFGIGGTATLTVTGRASKQPQQIPVVVPVSRVFGTWCRRGASRIGCATSAPIHT